MLGGACDSMFGRGLIEFRPKTLVSIGRDGSESVLSRVEYRSDGSRIAVLPQDPGSIGVLVFDFTGNDRIRAEGLGCLMARAGAVPAPHAGSGDASTPGRPTEPRAASAKGATAGAVLSLSVGAAMPGSTPIAGRSLMVLKSDAQAALVKGGLQSTPYRTALQNWIRACLGASRHASKARAPSRPKAWASQLRRQRTCPDTAAACRALLDLQ
jgi:hypothetical protein